MTPNFNWDLKMLMKKGADKMKSYLQTIDFENDTINFKIKK